MGFPYKYIKFFFVLLQTSSIAYSLNIDCDGKAFHCVNATHFKICVDLGGGVSKTVDDFLLPCPDNTVCMRTNRYECEYHETTTITPTSTTTIKSDFSEISELSEVSVIPLLTTEKKPETTTAAFNEITKKATTLPILKITESTSSKPASKSAKDEKLTSETFLEFNPTESYLVSAEQYFDTNHGENSTKDFKIFNKTENFSQKSADADSIYDDDTTLYNITNKSISNIENNNDAKAMDQEYIKPDNETNVNIFPYVHNDLLEHTMSTNNFTEKREKINDNTIYQHVNNVKMKMSNSSGSEKDEVNLVNKPTTLDLMLLIGNISFLEKIKNQTENRTEDFDKTNTTEYYIIKPETASWIHNTTSSQKVDNATLSVSKIVTSEKDEDKRLYETTMVYPTLLIRNVSLSERNINRYENKTEDFDSINKTEYFIKKSENTSWLHNATSDQNVNDVSSSVSKIFGSKKDKDQRMHETETVDPTVLIKNIMFEQKFSNDYDKRIEGFNKTSNATSGQNVSNTSLTVSSSLGTKTDKDERIYEKTLKDPPLLIRNISFVEKISNYENKTDDFINVDKLEYSIQKTASGEKSASQNIHNTSLNLSNSTGFEKNKSKRVNKFTLGDPTIVVTTLSVEKSFNNDENKEEYFSPTSNPSLTAGISLAVNDDNIDAKLNISGSETLDSQNDAFHEKIEQDKVPTSSTNNKNNYLKTVTNIFANDDQLLNNVKNTSSYPDIIVSIRNITFDEMNLTNNTLIQKPYKEFGPKISHLYSTESPVNTVTSTIESELPDNFKKEKNNLSTFSNYSNFSVSLNNKTMFSGTAEITKNVTSTIEEPSNINKNKSNSDDDQTLYRDISIKKNVLNDTILYQTQGNSSTRKYESLKEEDYKLLPEAINNIMEPGLRDKLPKIVIQIEATMNDSADLTVETNNKFTALSNSEINKTDVPTNEILKSVLETKKNNVNNLSNRTSSISNYNLLHEIESIAMHKTLTTDDTTVLDIIHKEPNKKNADSFHFTSPAATEKYNSHSLDSTFIPKTTKSHQETKANDSNFDYDVTLGATSNIVHNSSLLTSTERYVSSNIALEDLSLTNLGLVMNNNINGSSRIDVTENILLATKKNETKVTKTVVNTHNIKNTSENIYTTYNTGDDSTLFIATTDSNILSTIMSNSNGRTKSEVKIGKPNITSTYSANEKVIAGALEISESQISPPSTFDIQKRVDTPIIPSVLNTTLIESYETTTKIEQIHLKEIEADSNKVLAYDSIQNKIVSNSTRTQINKLSFNNSLPNNIFKENLSPSRSNETSSKREQFTFDQPKIVMNSTEINKSLLLNRYPIHLLLLSKTNQYNASPDNISDAHDNTDTMLINTIHNLNTNNTKINNTTTSVVNKSNLSVPIDLQKTVTSSKASKLSQTLNSTESTLFKRPIVLIDDKTINFTNDENKHITKPNTTVNYNNDIFKNGLPSKLPKKDDTIGVLLPTQDYSFSSNNDSKLLKVSEGTPETLLTRNTQSISVKSVSEGETIARELKNTNLLVNVNNLTTSYGTTRNSETNTEDEFKNLNSQNNNHTNLNTSLDLQMTNGIQQLLGTILEDKKENSSHTLDPSRLTPAYESSTNAYNSKLESNENNPALKNTEIKVKLNTELSGKGLKDEPNITQSITTNTGVLPATIILTNDNRQNTKEQNVTKSNSLNLSGTVFIRQNDDLNLLERKELPTQISLVVIYNVTNNKPVTYAEHKNISQHKDIKTNEPILPNNTKTEFVRGNVNNTMNNNLRKPASPLSILTSLNKSSLNTSILEKATETKNNYTNLNIIHVNTLPLGAKSTSFNQAKYNNETHTVMTQFPENNAKTDGMNANKCFNQPNGKYADKNDCRKFYLCLGDAMPVLGECPNGTVFSESKKQCTKNLSQCYRNNQFICLSPGRYYDLSVKNIYYICVKNRGKFIQFKYQCINGYSLNETIVKCIKDSDTSAQNNSDLNIKEDSASISIESTSKATETLKIKSSKKGDTEFECKKEGKYPHPKKCNEYFLCTKIKKSVFQRKVKTCDSGEIFDKEKKLCIDSDSHEC